MMSLFITSFMDFIPFLKILGLVGGSSLVTVLVSWWLGKTKQEAETILNWEKINTERDIKLLAEIKRLEDKLDRMKEHQDETEKNYRDSMQRYENDNFRLRDDLVKCRKINGKLQLEIDRLEDSE